MSQYGVSTAGDFDGVELAEFLHAEFSEVWQDIGQQSAEMLRTEVQYGPDPVGPTYVFEDSVLGAVGGDGISSQVAVLVRKLSASGGRENRGRMYVPFSSEAIISSQGVIAGTNVAIIQAELDDFVATVEAANHTLVILHTSSSDPTPIVSMTVAGVVATQRRRLVRV